MKIIVHDYAGLAFTHALVRGLARNGHDILYLYSTDIETPKGVGGDTRVPGLRLKGLGEGAPVPKYSFIRRWRRERSYGCLLAREIRAERPDIVISNGSLDVQAALPAACRAADAAFVFWVQDLYGPAVTNALAHIPLIGPLVGRWYEWCERRLLRRADRVIVITEDFVPLMEKWGVASEQLCVIPNWAPLDQLPVRDKDNDWARRHGLAGDFCFLYAGTLGLKHSPELLLALARQMRAQEAGLSPDHAAVRVVVVSQGLGADWLQRQKEADGLDNLMILPFQPPEDVADMLASGDVLLAVLQPDAGVYSVPSKILSYLCAARPVLAALPEDNRAARVLNESGAGVVVPPGEAAAFCAAALALLSDAGKRRRFGRFGRAYAEKEFAPDLILGKFDVLCRELASHKARP